jgi:hypothetical protein
MANDQHPHSDAAIDEEAQLISWFGDQFGVLVEKFKPSLELKHRWLG